jgi:hypothetical protein
VVQDPTTRTAQPQVAQKQRQGGTGRQQEAAAAGQGCGRDGPLVSALSCKQYPLLLLPLSHPPPLVDAAPPAADRQLTVTSHPTPPRAQRSPRTAACLGLQQPQQTPPTAAAPAAAAAAAAAASGGSPG